MKNLNTLRLLLLPTLLFSQLSISHEINSTSLEQAEHSNVSAKLNVTNQYLKTHHPELSPNTFNSLKKAALQGDPEAEYQLAWIYLKDPSISFLKSPIELLRKSAAQGNTNALKSLALMYEYGLGGVQSNEEASKLYKKAFNDYAKEAKQGNAEAQYNLAWMYDSGKGIEQSEQKAFQWYERSANQGFPPAQLALGIMYENGTGVEESETKAFQWYEKAAKQNNAEAQIQLAYLYKEGKGIEKSKEKSLYWQHKAAEQGYRIALFELGSNSDLQDTNKQENIIQYNLKFLNSKYIAAKMPQNILNEKERIDRMYTLAIDNLTAAYEENPKVCLEFANQGEPFAQYALGIAYTDKPKTFKEGMKWLKKSAAQGNELAKSYLETIIEE